VPVRRVARAALEVHALGQLVAPAARATPGLLRGQLAVVGAQVGRKRPPVLRLAALGAAMLLAHGAAVHGRFAARLGGVTGPRPELLVGVVNRVVR